jgi:hypothetical protein
MKTRNRWAGLTIAAAAFIAACADPAGLERSLVPESGSNLHVSVNPADVNTLITNTTGMPDGLVRVCKDTPAGDPSLPWSFSVTVVSEIDNAPLNAVVPPTTPVIINGVAGGAPECADVFISAKNGAELDRVTITEQALPSSEWALTDIHVERFKDGPSYTPPAGTPLDAASIGTRTATLYINDDMQRIVTFTNDHTAPPTGNSGCTPGYWKQDHHFDSWPAGYTPDMSFNVAMNFPGTNLFPNTFTMLDALTANGGGKNAFARHAAAAILNAASGFYGLTVAQVQAHALEAYNNQALINAKHTLFGDLNEQGCPLN